MKTGMIKIVFILGLVTAISAFAETAEKSKVTSSATAVITYTVTFNNDTDDGYVLAYPTLGKPFSSSAIKCCDSTAGTPANCFHHGPWYKGSVSPHKAVTLICTTDKNATANTLKFFAPSGFLSLVHCSVSSNAEGNNQVNASSCHVF